MVIITDELEVKTSYLGSLTFPFNTNNKTIDRKCLK